MKERPIIFSGEMVRAILEGRKTQTRRVVTRAFGASECIMREKQVMTWQEYLSRFVWAQSQILGGCPYGEPGDRLWVRETWQAQNLDGFWWHEITEHRELCNWAWTNPIEPAFEGTPPRWMPSLFMPRMASRITLEVVNIEVDRVQNITQADAKAEGAQPWFMASDGCKVTEGGAEFSIEFCPEEKRDYRKGYQILWDQINEKRGYGWDKNPWVWVVEFRAVQP
jgi:hypothetical protein